MKTVLVSIYDRKSEIYFPVEQKKTPAVAIRDFNLICNRQDTPFYKYPEDYCLCIVAEMDNETAIIKTMEKDRPRILAEAKDQIIKDDGGIIHNEKKN